MKVVIIGGSFAGLTCAKKLRDLSDDVEILVIDSNTQGAYIPNGLNLLYQGEIRSLRESLFMTNEELNNLPVTISYNHRVKKIDNKAKAIYVEHEGVVTLIAYDKLVCATGASPQSKYIEGADLPGVVTTKDYHSSREAMQYLDKAQHLVIIGSGPVGLEACDTYAKLGKKITLLEAGPRLDYKHTDADMLDDLVIDMANHGITLVTDARVKCISKTKSQLVIQTADAHFKADAVLLAVNVRPNSHLLKECVALADDQTVVINSVMQTSDPDIYAIGDLVSQMTPSGQKAYRPFISNAIRSAEVAAYHLIGHQHPLSPSVNVVGQRLFGWSRYSIGLTEEEASLYQDMLSHVYCQPISFLNNHFLRIKIIVNQSDGTILGAQVLSQDDVSSLVAQLITPISQGLTDADLVGQDFLVSFGKTDLSYHLHMALQRIYEMRLGICKSSS